MLLNLGFHQARVHIHGTITRIELLPEGFEKLRENSVWEKDAVVFAGQSLLEGPGGERLHLASSDEELIFLDIPLMDAARERTARPWLNL